MAASPYNAVGASAFTAGGVGSAQGTLTLQTQQSPNVAAGLRGERSRHRRLQAAAEGCVGDFAIASVLYADSAGCYLDMGDNTFEYTDGVDTFTIGEIAMYNSADSPSVWVAGTVVAAGTEGAQIDPHCHSDGDTLLHPHPADVETWLCDIDNTGTAYTTVTAEQFSAVCGCEAAAAPAQEDPAASSAPVDAEPAAPLPGTTAPVPVVTTSPVTGDRAVGATVAPTVAATAAAAVEAATVAPAVEAATVAPAVEAATVAPAVGAATVAPAVEAATAAPALEPATVAPAAGGGAALTSDTMNGACGELESLSMETTLPVLAPMMGCYQETGHEYLEGGGHFFTITGSSLRGQHSVFPGMVSATDPRWFLGFVAVDPLNTIVNCVSAQAPADGHPSTANWYCDNGSGTFALTSEDELSITCGCPSAEAEEAQPAEEMTTSPAVGLTEAPALTATTAPVVGGATTTPVVGGATMTPVVGEATTTPVVGEATMAPVVGEATTTPVVGEATMTPVVGEATMTPVVGEATMTPVVGEATMTPVVGEEATMTPVVGGEATMAPVVGEEATMAPVVGEGGTMEPIIDVTDAPEADVTEAPADHEEGEHTTSTHDGTESHTGATPAPTTVARGIVGPGETPAPSAGGPAPAGTASTSAASRTFTACFAGLAAAVGVGGFLTAIV